MAKRSSLGLLVRRFLMARKLRSFLSLFSILLGVGLLSALLTLNASMEQAVEAQVNRRLGSHNLAVGYRKPDTRLSEQDLKWISGQEGVTEVAGLLVPYLGEYHPELRPDLVYQGVSDTALGREQVKLESGAFPGPGEMAISALWAKKQGYRVGDSVRLPFPPAGEREVRISGLLKADPGAGGGIAYFERGWLEEVTGRFGATFALIRTGKGIGFAKLFFLGDRLRREKGDDLEVDLRSERNDMRRNLNALQPMAQGMGIAALLSAAFLLVASFRMSLTERTRELALLRAIGAAPGQVTRMMLTEGLWLGTVGSVLGALLGVGTAALFSTLMARLLNVEPVGTAVPWATVAGAAFGGVLTTLLSALGVALAAGRTEPLRAMRPDLPAQERGAKYGGIFGLVLAGFGAAVVGYATTLPREAQDTGFKALFASTGMLAFGLGLLLGIQRLLPLLIPPMAALLAPRPNRPHRRIAVRNLLRHRRRSGMSVGAMGLGLILVVGFGTMMSTLLSGWYEDARKQHPADIQLAVPTLYSTGVDRGLAQELADVDGITRVAAVGDTGQAQLVGYDWSRATPAYEELMVDRDRALFSSRNPLEYKARNSLQAGPADLPALAAVGAYRLVGGSLDTWNAESLAVVKEVAEGMGLKVGDRLVLNVQQGIIPKIMKEPVLREFTVTAIVETDSYRLPKWLVAQPFPNASERLRFILANAERTKLDAARHQVKNLVQTMEYSILEYSDAETALAETRSQTNQRVVLLLAVGLVMALVATMSLLNTMVSSVSERRRELALLRAVGAEPAQVRSVVLLEASLLALVGGLVGVADGVLLGSAVLWGLGTPLADIQLPWSMIAGGLAASLAMGMLAVLRPVRAILQMEPAEAVRVD